MATLCNCESGLANLGKPSCVQGIGVTSRLILVQLVADDGTENKIDITDTLDEAYFTARINDTDSSKRWYPTPTIENVEDTKADSILESLNSGKNIFIQEGARTFSGLFVQESAVFLGKLKSGRCVDFGVFFIDENGSLVGKKSKDGAYLKPVAVDKDTFNPILIKKTDTTSEKVQLTFEFKRTEKDEDLRLIDSSDIAVDLLDTSEVSGLLDVNAAVTSITTVDFVVTLSFDYGSIKDPLKLKGVTDADLTLLDNGGSPISITGLVTEVSDGVYEIGDFTAQSPSDVLTLKLNKDGFEMADVSITIP